MNEKFKLKFKTAAGADKTFTENHPKLNATSKNFADATNAIEEAYGYTTVGVVLQSDTTIWTPGE